MATQTAPVLQESAAANPAALLAPESTSSIAHEEASALAAAIEARIADAPLIFEVRLPIRNLRVKDILALEKGKVFETEWPGDEDIPGGCGAVQLVWTEFEVIEKKLAVRVTRLA